MNHRNLLRLLDLDQPYGRCHCGCGQQTKLAKQTDRRSGTVRGEPLRFVPGHQLHKHPEYAVDPETGCWNWQRSLTSNGYGRAGRKALLAHRVFYERHKGPIPDGLQIDHLCCNKRCVNPDHLEAVTAKENSRRSAATKLTADQVRGIKRGLEQGIDRQLLADEFGTTRQNVNHINSGRSWVDVVAA